MHRRESGTSKHQHFTLPPWTSMDWHLIRSLVAEIHGARRSVALSLHERTPQEWRMNGWSLRFAQFLDFDGFRWLLQEALYWVLISFLNHPKSAWFAVAKESQRASISESPHFFRSYVPLIVPLVKQDVCLLWSPLWCWTSLPEFQRLVCCGVCTKVPNLKTNLMFEVEAGTEWWFRHLASTANDTAAESWFRHFRNPFTPLFVVLNALRVLGVTGLADRFAFCCESVQPQCVSIRVFLR